MPAHPLFQGFSHELYGLSSSICLLWTLLGVRAGCAAVFAVFVMSPKTMYNCAHTGNARVRPIALQRVHLELGTRCARVALHMHARERASE